jgi:hypothetical protein
MQPFAACLFVCRPFEKTMEKHETKAQEVVTQGVSCDIRNGRDKHRG